MVTQSVFASGEWVLWVVMMLGFVLFGRVDVESLANSRNGLQMESMLGKVYAMFALQGGVAVVLVFYPFVMMGLGVHWFFITANTVMTLSIGLVALLLVREAAERVNAVKERLTKEKGKHKRLNFVEENWYRGYKLMVWAWVLGLVIGVILAYRALTGAEMSIWSDVPIWFGTMGYLVLYYGITYYAVKKIESTFDGDKLDTSKPSGRQDK